MATRRGVLPAPLSASGQAISGGEHFANDFTDVLFGRPVIGDACSEADRASNASVREPNTTGGVDSFEKPAVQLV